MALIWQTYKKGRHYEVRGAGKSVRLYTDGVFHSQWNPSRPLAGHLWDLLLLPVLLHPHALCLNKVLILGVGGGAVINALNHFLQPKKIIGVDLDEVHLSIAWRYFLEHSDNVSLVNADAKTFVGRQRPASTDLIIEDLFCGADHDATDAVRAIPMDDDWLCSLGRLLNNTGVLAVNFENVEQLQKAFSRKLLKRCGFESLYQFTMHRYENSIAVGLKSHRAPSFFDRQLMRYIYTKPSRQVRDLHFNYVRLF